MNIDDILGPPVDPRSDDDLSPTALKVWQAICVNGEAGERELLVRLRPVSLSGLRCALAELERGGLIAKRQAPSQDVPTVNQ